MAKSKAGAKLLAYRKRRGLSLRQAARELQVVYVTLTNWEGGARTPSAAYRAAIERWTGGEVAADSWVLTLRERIEISRAASVLPHADESGPQSVVDIDAKDTA